MPKPPPGAISPTTARRPLTAAAISLGCPKNLVDTEVMLGLLHAAGFSIIADMDEADVLLVNTCSFIGPARDEAAEALRQAVHWRTFRADRALVCAGCWPQMNSEHLRARFPEVDAFMGPGDVANIASIVQSALRRSGPTYPQAAPSAYLYDEHTPRLRTTPPWTAYLKVAEGCSHRCTFCVIPHLRGRYRSRPLPSIIAEARHLAAQGVREINLIAQDTTAYRDTDGADIGDLLSELAEVEELRWLRLLYGFPTRITARLIEVIASHSTICDYLDLPFQHADRGVLRAMGRPGDADTYLRLITRLRKAMPDIAIRTSFLVGFPGEGEEEFQCLLDFIQEAQLDRVGAFCYSRERGTPAADMPQQVPPEVAGERYHRLMSLQQRIAFSHNQRWVGRQIEVLIESPRESAGEWVGRTFRDAPEVDGSVHLSVRREPPRPAFHPGAFVQATVTAAGPYDLRAQLLSYRPRSTP